MHSNSFAFRFSAGKKVTNAIIDEMKMLTLFIKTSSIHVLFSIKSAKVHGVHQIRLISCFEHDFVVRNHLILGIYIAFISCYPSLSACALQVSSYKNALYVPVSRNSKLNMQRSNFFWQFELEYGLLKCQITRRVMRSWESIGFRYFLFIRKTKSKQKFPNVES